MDPRKKKHEVIICLCNSISKSKIEAAILRGAKNVDDIGDATTAGMGQCGGSCRPDLEKMLSHYLQTGQFLSNVTKKTKR